MTKGKFLILGSKNYANRRILHEFREKGYEAAILNPENLMPFVNDKKTDRMYVFNPKDEEPKRIFRKSVKGIVPRIGYDLQFYSKSVEHLHKNIGIPTTATATALLDAQDKIRTIQMLSQHGVKTPKTMAIKKPQNLKWVIKQLGGFPVVAKLIFGSRGIGVFILTEALSASTALDAFASQGHSLLLQQFIETSKKDKNKHDFRAVVIDGKVVAAIKRNSVGDDFRTNASLKEDCENAELDDDMRDIAIKAAAAVGLDCAGVDLARDIATNEIYCYEVNGNFNFQSTERYSKKNVAIKIVEYAIKLADKEKGSEVKQESWNILNMLNNEPEFDLSVISKDVKGIPFGDFPKDDDDNDDADILPDDVENNETYIPQSKVTAFISKTVVPPTTVNSVNVPAWLKETNNSRMISRYLQFESEMPGYLKTDINKSSLLNFLKSNLSYSEFKKRKN